MPKTQTVTAVMLTRDREAFLRLALATVDGDVSIAQWVIVDVGSTDGTKRFLRQWSTEGESRTVISVERGVGSARARNIGAAAAEGDLILFLDNDISSLGLDWLSPMVRQLERVADDVACAPRLVFPGTPTLIQSDGGGLTASGGLGLLRRGLPHTDSEASKAVAWSPAAALLIRAEGFRDVGGYDVSFDPVAVLEDVDLCLRLRYQGGAITHLEGAVLSHFEGTTFQHLGYDLRSAWHKHRSVIFRRWGGLIGKGPVVGPDEIRWRYIRKDYSDLSNPSVGVVKADSSVGDELTFFSSDRELPHDEKIVRLGVVGCGAIAQRGVGPGFAPPNSEAASSAPWFLGFGGAPNVAIVGAADVDVDRAESFIERFGGSYAFSSGEELMSLVPLEAIAVCTPTTMLAPETSAGLRRGLHVFVEKPVCVTEASLDELLRVREQFPHQKCVVDLPWLFHPAVAKVTQLVNDGELGRIEVAEVEFTHTGPESWAPSALWYREAAAGGAVLDLGLHVVSVLRAAVGESLELGGATGSTTTRSTAELVSSAGVSARATVGWDSPDSVFRISVKGDKGSLAADLISGSVQLHWHSGSVDSWSLGGRSGNLDPAVDSGPYREFVRSVVSGGDSHLDIQRLEAVLRLVLAWASAVG